MSSDSIIPRVRRLIEEDGAYLLPSNSVSLTKLNPSGSVEGDVAAIINGRASWVDPTTLLNDDYVNVTGDTMSGQLKHDPVSGTTALRTTQVAADGVLANKLLDADAVTAFGIFGDGKMEWGAGGASARDTNLYRLLANYLASDDCFVSNRTATTDDAFAARISTDTQSRFMAKASGSLEFGAGGASVRDTHVTRKNAGTLGIGGTSTASQLLVGDWPATAGAPAWVMVGHADLDQTLTGNYSLLINGSGQTILNSPSGQTTLLRIANSTIATIAATGISMAATMKVSQNAAPTVADDLTNKTYCDLKLPLAGGTMTGTLAFSAVAGARIQANQQSGVAVLGNKLVSSDANQAFTILGQGNIMWGAGGASALDTTMGRLGAGILGMAAGHKFQVNAAPTTGDDLCNRTFVTGLPSVISHRSSRVAAAISTTLSVIGQGDVMVAMSAAGANAAAIYIDPSDWGANGVRLKLRGWAATETDPTDSTLTIRLRQIGTISAGGVATHNVVGAGVTVTTTPNAANTLYGPAASSEITVTTAGWYIVDFQHSVNPAQVMTYGYTLMGRPA